MTQTQYYGTGTRKTSVARVYLRSGSGQFTINSRPIDNYFPDEVLKMVVRQPLQLAEMVDKFDVHAFVRGGGVAGQAGAIRMGVSRALLEVNSELRPPLKKEGFLRRDARKKERKKYGQRGARARFQFSKR